MKGAPNEIKRLPSAPARPACGHHHEHQRGMMVPSLAEKHLSSAGPAL
jgi:hypothetical protein